MSYEKLGFVKGQKLKADHLNHMEEGIANAGGFINWKGEVTWDSNNKMFNLMEFKDSQSSLFNKYEEIEVGIMMYCSSNEPVVKKYSFVMIGDTNIYCASEDGDSSVYPKAQIIERSDTSCALKLTPSTLSGAFGLYNPQILFVRLYPKV